jgi:hypothetical protein
VPRSLHLALHFGRRLLSHQQLGLAGRHLQPVERPAGYPPAELSYYRGSLYLLEKQSWGDDRRSDSAGSSGKNCHLKTDGQLAQRFGVAARTVRYDAGFKEALDRVAEIAGDEVRSAVLSLRSPQRGPHPPAKPGASGLPGPASLLPASRVAAHSRHELAALVADDSLQFACFGRVR